MLTVQRMFKVIILAQSSCSEPRPAETVTATQPCERAAGRVHPAGITVESANRRLLLTQQLNPEDCLVSSANANAATLNQNQKPRRQRCCQFFMQSDGTTEQSRT